MAPPVAGNLIALICMLCWSTSFPITGHLLETWHPMLLTPMRTGVAAVFLVIVCIACRQVRHMFRIPLPLLFYSCFLALGLSAYGFIWAQKLIDPVLAAIIVSAMPLFSLVMGRVARTERFSPQVVLGIVLAIVGGTIVSRANAVDHALAGSTWIGAGIMLTTVALYVWYTRSMVIHLPHVPDLPKAAAGMAVVTVFNLLVTGGGLALGLVPAEFDLAPPNFYLALWLGAIAVGLSTALWFLAARRIGVTVATMHHNLVPFYVILMGLFSGAVVTLDHVAGATMVIGGVILAQYRPRPAREPAA